MTGPGSYRAPAWLPGGHAQTIYAQALTPATLAGQRRELWTTPDEDVIAVDRLHGRADAPLVVLLHGLEGGSSSHYARASMQAIGGAGWRVALPHFRGCGGVANRLPRAYHSGDTAELDWLLRRFQGEADPGPLFVCGVSLGGNVLLKWLGEQGSAARPIVRAAVAVCAPVDLTAAGEALGRGFNRVYARHFLRTLRPKALDMAQRFPGLIDVSRVRAARTLRAFDDAVTAPLHGFVDAADYWRRASAKPLLGEIRVATLMLNARNDPFLPESFLPRSGELAHDVEAEFSADGGHVGFVAGRFPGNVRWLPRRIIDFFSSADRST